MAPDIDRGQFHFEADSFYFLRHGATADSLTGILQGHRDTTLIEIGRKAVARAADRLAKENIRSIHASSLRRARQSAAIVSARIGVPVSFHAGLMERFWGDFEGRQKNLRPRTKDPSSAEKCEDFSERILTTMKSIDSPKPALFVSHSGVFRVLSRYFGATVENPKRIENAGLHLFEAPGTGVGQWQIRDLTDT